LDPSDHTSMVRRGTEHWDPNPGSPLRARSLIPAGNPLTGRLNYPKWVVNLMAAKKTGVSLIEASADRIVVDTRVGRIIIEPESVRFHRSGRGRGRVLLGPDSSD